MAAMTDPSHLAAAALIGYLLGAVPFGLLLTRAAGLGDVRAIGSGTIGATNVLRTGRKGLVAATLLLDAAKGCAAAGIAVVLGHMFPVWLHFRGGKGIATGFGVLLAAAPLAGLAAGVVWLATAVLTRISSAGSLAAAVAARPQHRAPSRRHRAADRRRAMSEATACVPPAPRVWGR